MEEVGTGSPDARSVRRREDRSAGGLPCSSPYLGKFSDGMNGLPLLIVSKNLGHATTRMAEKHYSHLAPSFIADAIRAAAPRFGIKTPKKIVPIR